SPDNVPPVVSISSPAQGATLKSGLVDVKGVVDDASATVRVNGVQADQSGTLYEALVRLPLGDQTIRAEAVDPVGNRAQAEVQVRIDATIPRVSITSPSNAFAGVVGSGTFTVRGTVDPPGTLVFVNGSPAQVAGATWSLSLSLPAGLHDLIAT